MLSLGLDVWAVQRGVKAFHEEYASHFHSAIDPSPAD
jgi:hypothetical protein